MYPSGASPRPPLDHALTVRTSSAHPSPPNLLPSQIGRRLASLGLLISLKKRHDTTPRLTPLPFPSCASHRSIRSVFPSTHFRPLSPPPAQIGRRLASLGLLISLKKRHAGLFHFLQAHADVFGVVLPHGRTAGRLEYQVHLAGLDPK
jgi:hypothetical protein